MKLLSSRVGRSWLGYFIGFMILALGIILYNTITMPVKASALASGFNAGEIIDNGIFTNIHSMSEAQIQQFLNLQVPACDTNGTQPATEFGRPDLTHAQYAALQGWQAPPLHLLAKL